MSARPVYVTESDYFDEGTAQRIVADAIRQAAYDAQRHQNGSGTNVIDCCGRAMDVLNKIRGLQS